MFVFHSKFCQPLATHFAFANLDIYLELCWCFGSNLLLLNLYFLAISFSWTLTKLQHGQGTPNKSSMAPFLGVMGHMDVSENLIHSTPMDFKCPSFFPYKIFDIDRAHVDKRAVTVDMHILSSCLVIIVSHLNISWRYTKFRRFPGSRMTTHRDFSIWTITRSKFRWDPKPEILHIKGHKQSWSMWPKRE